MRKYQALAKIVTYIQQHAKVAIALIVTITLILGLSMLKLQFDADYSGFLPKDKEDFSLPSEATIDTVYSTDFILMVESKDLFNPRLLTAISTAMKAMDNHPSIGSSFSAFDFITVEKRGSRLVTVPMSPHSSDMPWTVEESELFRKRALGDDIARNLLISEDGEALVIAYRVLPNDSRALADFKKIWEPVTNLANTYTSGGSTITERVMHYLTRDLSTLLILSLVIILIVYYLSFRAKRAMFIPFSLSLIGIVWSLGIMSLLGYSMTIINVITPCLVLTLGSSYSIHVLTEYYQSYRDGHADYIGMSVTRIGKTIFLACITDVIGFLSLLTAQTDAFREFGISVSIGVTICALLSVTYLPAVLAVTIPPQKHQMDIYKAGFITSLVQKIGRLVIRKWLYFLSIFVIITAGFLLTKDRVGIETNYMSYFPKKDVIIKDSLYLAQKMQGLNNYYITFDAPGTEKGYFLNPDNLQKIREFELAVKESCDDITHVLSFPTYVSFMNKVSTEGSSQFPASSGIINLLSRMLVIVSNQMSNSSIKMLLNEDASRMTMTMKVWDSKEKDLQTMSSALRVEQNLKEHMYLLPEDIIVNIWGDGNDGIKYNKIIMDDQKLSTLVSFLLVFIVTFIGFRSLKTGLFSIIPILIGIMANYIIMYLTGIPFDLVTIGFSSVTVGVGIDNALHFLIRYEGKRKLKYMNSIPDLLEETMIETGRPILLTTLSIVAGLLMLTFGSYTPIKYFGVLVSLSLLNTMLATLFVLPPTILLVERIHDQFKKK